MKNIIVVIFFLLISCTSVKSKLQKFSTSDSITYGVVQDKDSVFFTIKNEISIPIYLYSKNSTMDSLLKERGYCTLKPLDFSVLKLKLSETNNFNYSTINPNVESAIFPQIHLPFLKQKSYKILQGFNGSFSHNKLNNRFALDFEIPVGDSICAVADGVVIKLIESYKSGGSNIEFNGFDNFLWLYHPKLNIISSYAHLKKNGVLVKIGQYVKANEVIALSGNTGYSTEPHLHFHLLKLNNKKELESIPFNFIEGYNGTDLTKGSFVLKK